MACIKFCCTQRRSFICIFVQAIEEYGDVDVYLSNFRPLRATLSGLPDRVLMKLIVCATTNKVVGVHMCGDDAPEIIQVCMILYYSSPLLLLSRLLCHVSTTM